MRVNVVVNRGVFLVLPLLVLMLACASCNKGGAGPAVVGRWTQFKLHLYQLDSNKTVYDTTYLAPFTKADFIQFYSNNTCTIGSDHYYYPNAYGYPTTPQAIPPITSNMNVATSGANYVLTTQSTLTNPGGFLVTDTVSISNTNILLLHSVFYSHVPGYISVTDAYYQK